MIKGIKDISYIVIEHSISNITAAVNVGETHLLTDRLNPKIPFVYVDEVGKVYLLSPENLANDKPPLDLFSKINESVAASRIKNSIEYYFGNREPNDTLGAIIHAIYEQDFLKVAESLEYKAQKVIPKS